MNLYWFAKKIKKKLTLIICLFANIGICCAQMDSLSKSGTIKISKPEGKVFVRTFSNFHIYYNDPVNVLTYSDFILNVNQNRPVKTSPRFITIEALPKTADNDTLFDFTSYFLNNKFIQTIRLQKEETDTVRLLIYVDKKGITKYLDLSPVEHHGEDVWIYDMKKREYKIDVVHEKTKLAFNKLIADKWSPAKIKTLKKQPSKHKIPYDVTDGYMQGILTIIYSGIPFNDQ
jgi:hypothetical protein